MMPFGIRTVFGDIKRKILGLSEDYEAFIWVINALDDYRIGKRVRDSDLREKIRIIRRKFNIPSLNMIYKDIEFIKSIAEKKEPRMKFYSTLMITLQFLIKQGLAIFLLLAFITAITFKSIFTTEQMQWVLYGVILGAVAVVWVRWYIRDKIMRIYAEHRDEYKKNQLRIREYIQELIDTMKKDLKKTEENPKKYKMVLYYADYKNMKVVKSPNWWRYYYVGMIDTD